MIEQDIIDRLRAACAAAGGQKQFAEQHGFSSGYISDVLSGRRGLADRLLAALHIERVISYRDSHDEHSDLRSASHR